MFINLSLHTKTAQYKLACSSSYKIKTTSTLLEQVCLTILVTRLIWFVILKIYYRVDLLILLSDIIDILEGTLDGRESFHATQIIVNQVRQPNTTCLH